MSTAISSPATYQVMPYRPDGGFALPGVMMLIGALFVVGGVLGFAAHFISEYIYLIILFPALIGLVLGATGVRMVTQGRIRNPWLGGLAGFIGGTLAMFIMHYSDYRTFAQAMASIPAEVRANAEDPEIREALGGALGVNGFWSFMDFQAQQGIEINRAGSSGKGMNLGYHGSWIYWLVELLIVAGITFGMVRSAAAAPYCAACEQWKESRVLGVLAGDPVALAGAVSSGQLEPVRAAVAPEGNLRFSVACCTSCVGRGAADVKLELISFDRKGNQQAKVLSHTSYPPESLPQLAALFTPAPPPATPPAPTPA